MFLEERHIKFLEKKIGYKFKDIFFLKQALTHSSYLNKKSIENIQSNERLEFLGDSLLGFMVAKIIFELFPTENEGIISKIKGYWISSKALSKIANEIGIDKAILLGEGEEKSGGRRNGKNLSSAFEALVAAIYLDGGIKKSEAFISRIFKKRIKKINKEVMLYDYKTRLQENYQEKYKDTPVYNTKLSGEIFESKVFFDGKTIGCGKGSSKKNAEQEAARVALNKLEKVDNRKRGR